MKHLKSLLVIASVAFILSACGTNIEKRDSLMKVSKKSSSTPQVKSEDKSK